MKRQKILMLGIVAALTAGCSQQGADIDQVNLCEVRAWQHDATSSKCKRGQKIVYLPDTWGNEQLPILFAAVNCDMRYNVALTRGAVTCIYNPITPKKSDN